MCYKFHQFNSSLSPHTVFILCDKHKLRSLCCVLLLWAHTFSSAFYSQAHSISLFPYCDGQLYVLTRQTEVQQQTAVVALCTCGPQLTLTNTAVCLAHHALAINRGQGVDCNTLPSEVRNIGVLNWSTSVLRHCCHYCYVIS